MRKSFIILLLFPAVFMRSAAQNVGIGTSSPTEKLHVAGNIKGDTVKPNAFILTPNAGSGKTLTSDAAGNATWQERTPGGGVGFGSWGDCNTNGVSEYHPIVDPTGSVNEHFGFKVSISGNFAIVGALLGGPLLGEGSACIYQLNGSSWEFMQKLTNPSPGIYDNFSGSVSISGNYAIVGAYGDDSTFTDQGSAYIYQFNGTSWVMMQKLFDITGAAYDQFGFSVSISGNYAIVGSLTDDESFSDQGSASIYHFNGSNWVLQQKITDVTGSANARFGGSVSISGNFAIVGAYLQSSASIYKYDATGQWVLDEKLTNVSGSANDYFGFSVSVHGNYAIVGAYQDDSTFLEQGSVSIYKYTGTDWVLMQKLTDERGESGDGFGFNVCISGDYAIVGAAVDDVGSNLDQGSASIFLRVGLEWQKLQYMTDPAGKQYHHFGIGTSIDAATKRFLIGSDAYAGGSGKAVFGKIN